MSEPFFDPYLLLANFQWAEINYYHLRSRFTVSGNHQDMVTATKAWGGLQEARAMHEEGSAQLVARTRVKHSCGHLWNWTIPTHLLGRLKAVDCPACQFHKAGGLVDP